METSLEKDKKLLLSRTECNIMRGLAILLIVTNNFGHLINGVHPDNEYSYNYENVLGFIDSLKHPGSLLPLELLSFYSPFGVMLFIFLSGYGLTLKYENGSGKQTGHVRFVIDHYTKLFSMQAKGLALFLVFYLLYFSSDFFYFWPFIKQLLMVENINPQFKIMPGPFWFFGMIMEIYIIYRFLMYKKSSLLIMIVAILSLLLMAFLEPNGSLIRYLRINFCLALLPFSLGVLAARHWDDKNQCLCGINKCLLWFALSFILLTLCKFNFYSWLLMPIFVVATAITMVKLLCAVSVLTKIFIWLGSLSGVMFVIHPAIREILFVRANESGHCYAVLFIYLFLTIVLSVLLKPAFSK